MIEAAIVGAVLGLITQRRALVLALLAAIAAGRTWFVASMAARYGEPWSDGRILINLLMFVAIGYAVALGIAAWRARRESKGTPEG